MADDGKSGRGRVEINLAKLCTFDAQSPLIVNQTLFIRVLSLSVDHKRVATAKFEIISALQIESIPSTKEENKQMRSECKCAFCELSAHWRASNDEGTKLDWVRVTQLSRCDSVLATEVFGTCLRVSRTLHVRFHYSPIQFCCTIARLRKFCGKIKRFWKRF